MSSSFGNIFKISTWGESHGESVGVVVDGCPSKIPISSNDIQHDLDRRKPGQSKITTPRKESDKVNIVSGVFNGMTLGTPIAMVVNNSDARPEAYSEMEEKFRPSHADYTYQEKYGIRDHRGGGRSSARETIARVSAGAISKKVIKELFSNKIEVVPFVESIGHIKANVDLESINQDLVESNIVRTGDSNIVEEMIDYIKRLRSEGNSIGGVIKCVIRNVPAGLGEPIFDRLEADLSKAMLSIPASKGFEIGSGFEGTLMTGKDHNDVFYMDGKKVKTKTNYSGGVQGGISNGQDIVFRVAFKPTATILSNQDTVDIHGNNTEISCRGRHDPCVLPRAVVIVEAMSNLVLVDHFLRRRALLS